MSVTSHFRLSNLFERYGRKVVRGGLDTPPEKPEVRRVPDPENAPFDINPSGPPYSHLSHASHLSHLSHPSHPGLVGAIVSCRRAREREAVLEAPSVPVGASGAGPKGMVAVSDSSWPWGAPRPVRDPARG